MNTDATKRGAFEQQRRASKSHEPYNYGDYYIHRVLTPKMALGASLFAFAVALAAFYFRKSSLKPNMGIRNRIMLGEILDAVQILKTGQVEIMSAISDLQAADAAIQAAVTANTAAIASAVTLIQGFQAGTINADDPAVEAVVADLAKAGAALGTATGSLTAAVTPAPVPTPAPAPVVSGGTAAPKPTGTVTSKPPVASGSGKA